MALATAAVASSQDRAQPFAFTDITAAAGIDFVHVSGETGRKYLVESMGSGAVFFDYDGDLDPDLYLVNGGALPGFVAAGPVQGALYRNEGRGRFTDVTAASGLAHEGYGMGAVAGDYDNDGDQDLFVTHFGRDRLFRNNGDGTFTDVTEKAGVGNPLWGSSAVWSDLDGDGDLDLFVANYVDWSVDKNSLCYRRGAAKPEPLYCPLNQFQGVPDELYRNRGDGTFEAVGKEAGVALTTGKGLGVVALDENVDGLPDLFVANDQVPNFLFRNLGGMRFADVALEVGVAYDANGSALAGMGVDAGDYDQDGDLDLYVTNFEGEHDSLYRRDDKGFFTEVSAPARLMLPSMKTLSFGTAFADLDNDSLLDVVVANGHLESVGGAPQAQPKQLFRNLGQGLFEEARPSGGGFDGVGIGRGLALADIDGDGDQDVLVTNNRGRAQLLRNDTPSGNVLRLLLVGRRSNRDAVGARLLVDLGDVRQVFEVRSGSSYLSQNERIVHIGLGNRSRVEGIRIRWPGAGEESLGPLAAGQLAVVREGSGVIASHPLRRYSAAANTSRAAAMVASTSASVWASETKAVSSCAGGR
jgi:hypothetical protein